MESSRSSGTKGSAGSLIVAAVFTTALVLWLFTHPLLSIDNHDARVYAILGLHHLNPDAYARDPFFLFGSQDSYSLFSYLYAPLIDKCGLTVAGALLQLVGGGLWCTASLLFAHVLLRRDGFPGWLWIMAGLAGAVMSANYSPNGHTFVVNESFATARSLAFPLGLMSIAYVLENRIFVAAVFALAATLVHPLLGIWPLVIILLAPLAWRWQLMALAAGSLLLSGLMLSELGSFVRFDPEWEAILRTYTHDVFVETLDQMRWREHLLQLGWLLSGAVIAGTHTAVGRWYRLVALVAMIGLLFAMLASYFWPSSIVVQAQLWRSMWLPAALMPFALCHLLGMLILRCNPPTDQLPWLVLLVICGVFMLYEHDGLLYLVLIFGIVAVLSKQHAMAAVVNRWRAHGQHTKIWLPLLAGGLLFLLLPLYWGELTLLAGAINRDFPPYLAELIGFLVAGGLGAGFALLAWILSRYGRSRWCAGVLSLILVWSLLAWDQRSERDRTWESIAAFGRQDQLRELIRPGEVVLWDGRLPLNAWYELRTAHYASPAQAIGMVFSREKTFELLRRVAHIRAADEYEHGEKYAGDGHPFRFRVPTGSGIVPLCGDEALDWVIVPADTTPSPNVPVITMTELGVSAYRCVSVRAVGGRQSSGKV